MTSNKNQHIKHN